MTDILSRGLQASQGSKDSRAPQELQVYKVLVSRDGRGHLAPQGCQAPRGTAVSVSQVSKVSQAPRERMALWGPKDTLDPKDQMELLDLQDKTDHLDPKVVAVWMVYLVLLVLLDCVYLELLDLRERRDRWASLDSQGLGAQRVCRVTLGARAWEPWGLRGLTERQGLMELRGQ